MNMTYNQNGEYIVAVGQKHSHARNRDEYNITLFKLLDILNNSEDLVDFVCLEEVCKADKVPTDDILPLLKTAHYYHFHPKNY